MAENLDSAKTALPPNPYDYSNPVTKPTAFAGRSADLARVKYYLDEAKTGRPKHIAFTGERAAGKTSMLNMVAAEAVEREFVVVKFDLFSSDSEPIRFFARLYDAILLAVVKQGMFGGLDGETWRKYRALVDSGQEASNLPLAFPTHFAAALKGDRVLSVGVLTDDLLLIQRGIGSRLVVIMDECDVLSSSLVSLEILKSLFPSLDKMMFVIAGTSNLFGAINKVFSPFSRQFQKYSVAPYSDDSDTQQCIEQPLTSIDIDAKSAFSRWPAAVEEIHTLTGGRPFEIRLLCHTMYGRMQRGEDSRMRVSLAVLEAVRSDLEHSQEQALGRLAHLYADLSRDQLNAIGMVRTVRGGRVSEVLTLSALDPEPRLATNVFKSEVDSLITLGVLAEESGMVRLCGDQFDEAYLRYSAAARGVNISARPVSASALLEKALRESTTSVLHPRPNSAFRKMSPAEFREKIGSMLSGTGETDQGENASEWAAIYRALRDAQSSHSALRFARFRLEVRGVMLQTYFPIQAGDEHRLSDLGSFTRFRERLISIEGSMEMEIEEFSLDGVLPIAELAPAGVQRQVAHYDDADAFRLYEAGDFEGAKQAFMAAFASLPSATRGLAIAYQSLLVRSWDDAVQWSTLVIDTLSVGEETKLTLCIAAYDRALAWVMLGENAKARLDLRTVLDLWSDGPAFTNVYISRVFKSASGIWELSESSMNMSEEAFALLASLEA
jgi:hypothetical protein